MKRMEKLQRCLCFWIYNQVALIAFSIGKHTAAVPACAPSHDYETIRVGGMFFLEASIWLALIWYSVDSSCFAGSELAAFFREDSICGSVNLG